MKPQPSSIQTSGFSILEVMVALSVLTITLITVYQSFSTSLFIIGSSNNLWKAMNFSQKELLRWERSIDSNVSITQGNFAPDHEMAGFSWRLTIEDVPVFAVMVRSVEYQLTWKERGNDYSYHAQIYINPQ